LVTAAHTAPASADRRVLDLSPPTITVSVSSWTVPDPEDLGVTTAMVLRREQAPAARRMAPPEPFDLHPINELYRIR